MPINLEDLVTPRTKEQFLEQTLLGLQGVSYVVKEGAGFGNLLADGVASGNYSVRIRIALAGGLGVGRFEVSTDGGSTYGASVLIPPSGVYSISGTGAEITFVEGTDPGYGDSFSLGDLYSFELTTPTFPTASYVIGSTPRTIFEKDAVALEDLSRAQVEIAKGGYIGLAGEGWGQLNAEQFYNLTPGSGANLVGNVLLADAASSGPHTIVADTIWVGTVGGLRFLVTSGGTLSQGGTLSVQVKAESAGAQYNVGAGAINQILTSTIPGGTVSNPNPVGGSWIVTPGADRETLKQLASRCRSRWPELSTGAVEDVYKTWALEASGGVVTRTVVRPSTTVEGELDVFLAQNTGTVDSSVVADVQEYLDLRVPWPATANVQSATAHPITVEATLFVRAGYQASALAGAEANVSALFSGGINSKQEELEGLGIGATIYLTQIVEQLQLPTGVRNVTLVSPAVDTVLDPEEVATLTLDLSAVEV